MLLPTTEDGLDTEVSLLPVVVLILLLEPARRPQRTAYRRCDRRFDLLSDVGEQPGGSADDGDAPLQPPGDAEAEQDRRGSASCVHRDPATGLRLDLRAHHREPTRL